MPPRRPTDSGSAASGPNKRARAKHACRECNARRVKCNVMQCNPCSNCEAAGTQCEVLPSRRGRIQKRQTQSDASATTAASPGVQGGETISVSLPWATVAQNITPDTAPQQNEDELITGASTTSQSQGTSTTVPATLFYGESNPLTLIPGSVRHGQQPSSRESHPQQKAQLHFPIHDTPQSASEHDHPANIEHLSAAASRYLQDEGALTLPDMKGCMSTLQAYFTWFHPCFPILDRAEFSRRLAASQASYLLLQCMLFIGAAYCDDATITSMGFSNRAEAKSLLYTRARLLFHADWEKDRLTLIQSLFLLSFWRGGPSDVRDVRYWLGVVIGVAESHGLHRSTRFATSDPSDARIRKRIWWSIYVRERQSAASLGLPSRIRDDDCDVEPLAVSDLETEVTSRDGSQFGSCKPEHVNYAINMVNLAQILGRVVDLHFAPGRQASTPEQLRAVDDALQAWRQGLPEEMNRGVEDGTASVWGYLLHLAYNHLRILIHRHNFIKQDESDSSGQIVVAAATKISRIAEDMLAQGTLRYGQMHSVTSLFAALCIHTISIKQKEHDVSRRIAENRAQMCLLGLQEIQKYWRINNNVLDLFLQYLDVSITQRIRGTSGALSTANPNSGLLASVQQPGDDIDENHAGGELLSRPLSPQTQLQSSAFEDQFLNLLYWPCEGDEPTLNLESVLQTDDPVPLSGFNTLGRSL
ncbi:n-terminal binuclear Zn cluster-containing protein [Fusarium pseudocircinatum]|uniref:N-terminal binuclear Zn cluster-containing protein n=1 Tax=Fusarium pseudocircinatum TaxID=56676 RepID=A0A8H5NX11_9HYPO|nr:n-terminal binuclear Zn cluster-containing protein [Fusarium pseudocircinatum]